MTDGGLSFVEFRRLVDSAKRREFLRTIDLESLYEYVGLPLDGIMTRIAAINELQKKIRDAFSTGTPSAFRHCRDLLSATIYHHLIFGWRLQPYLTVIEYLCDGLRGDDSDRLSSSGDWRSAIGYAVDHYMMVPEGYHGPDLQRVYTREGQISRAAKWLSDHGYRVEILGSKVRLTDTAEQKLLDDLHEAVQRMGGANLARRVFSAIGPLYDKTQERYHIVRRTSTIGGGEAQVPFAYLLNLAAKYPVRNGLYANGDADWQRLIALSVCYSALFDVQDFYPNMGFYLAHDSIADHLRRLALFDNMFRLDQMRGSDVVRLLSGLLTDIDPDQLFGEGWTIGQAIDVVSVVMEATLNSRGPVIIEEKEIHRKCRHIDRSIVGTLLRTVLSHSQKGANQTFVRPTDLFVRDETGGVLAGQDFFYRPLLRHGRDQYLLMDRSICAPGFLEAIFAKLRVEIPKFDESRGKMIEKFLLDEFHRRGIQALSGTYSVGSLPGQCDLVVETRTVLFFIEVKKKALTRSARAGSPAHILIDLAESLVDALFQAGQHEIAIRQHGSLELNDNGQRIAVDLNGREIEKIAVSLLDFGGFQDRLVLKQFLESSSSVTFNVDTAELHDRFERLNRALKKIKAQTEKLIKLRGTDWQPFFGCWFMSVPQILNLLDGVSDAEGLRDRLWSIRHVSFGSQDIYFEFAQMLNMKMNAKSGQN